MPDPEGRLDDWPVYPEFVEGVMAFRLPEDTPEGPMVCDRCGTEILEENCMGVPGRGVFHSQCWTEED